LQPVKEQGAGSKEQGAGSKEQGAQKNHITFAPSGARGVIAYVDGQPVASA
jgi:hypothetical protein